MHDLQLFTRRDRAGHQTTRDTVNLQVGNFFPRTKSNHGFALLLRSLARPVYPDFQTQDGSRQRPTILLNNASEEFTGERRETK